MNNNRYVELDITKTEEWLDILLQLKKVLTDSPAVEFELTYADGFDFNVANILLLGARDKNEFQFINVTKGHICPCIFKTRDEALFDLVINHIKTKKYSKVLARPLSRIIEKKNECSCTDCKCDSDAGECVCDEKKDKTKILRESLKEQKEEDHNKNDRLRSSLLSEKNNTSFEILESYLDGLLSRQDDKIATGFKPGQAVYFMNDDDNNFVKQTLKSMGEKETSWRADIDGDDFDFPTLYTLNGRRRNFISKVNKELKQKLFEEYEAIKVGSGVYFKMLEGISARSSGKTERRVDLLNELFKQLMTSKNRKSKERSDYGDKLLNSLTEFLNDDITDGYSLLSIKRPTKTEKIKPKTQHYNKPKKNDHRRKK